MTGRELPSAPDLLRAIAGVVKRGPAQELLHAAFGLSLAHQVGAGLSVTADPGGGWALDADLDECRAQLAALFDKHGEGLGDLVDALVAVSVRQANLLDHYRAVIVSRRQR